MVLKHNRYLFITTDEQFQQIIHTPELHLKHEQASRMLQLQTIRNISLQSMQHLVEIHFDHDFNEDVNDVLPSSLRKLVLCDSFNRNVDNLPSSIHFLRVLENVSTNTFSRILFICIFCVLITLLINNSTCCPTS